MKKLYVLASLSFILYSPVTQSAERLLAAERPVESTWARSAKDRPSSSFTAKPEATELGAAQAESPKIGEQRTSLTSIPAQDASSKPLLVGPTLTSIPSTSTNGSSVSLQPVSSIPRASTTNTNSNGSVLVKRESPREKFTKTISSAFENITNNITSKVRSISWPLSAEEARNAALARAQEAEIRARDVLKGPESTVANAPTSVGVTLKITGVTTLAQQIGGLLKEAFENKNDKNTVKVLLSDADYALQHAEALAQQAIKTAQAFAGDNDPSNPALESAQKSADAVESLKTALQLTQQQLLPK